jgi:two-component system cell cycle response regulator
VTLRARLTAAFLAVVLGPVLLGAIFVGATVAVVSRDRAVERLDVAAAAVRSGFGALCERLRAAATTAALLTAAGRDPAGAVDRALSVSVTGPDGSPRAMAGRPAPQPWADCAETPPPGPAYAGIGVRVHLRAPGGAGLGYATAVQPIDEALVRQFAGIGGAGVTVLSTLDGPVSSEPAAERRRVADAARRLSNGAVGETDGGRYVRRLDPEPGQPLPLALAVDPVDRRGLVAVLIAVVGLAGLLAVAVAWWLARSTTRPLTELAVAVDRVAAGDLAARVPVRTADEVGRLGATFNRMTREMRGYVRALTESRDQLRGSLRLLGDTLSSTHDPHRILEVILRTARAATGARSGVVLLFDPPSGLLVGQCVDGQGVDGPVDLAALRLKPGDGLLGTVAASGVPRRGRLCADGPPLSPHEPRCDTFVAVPFAGPSADHGRQPRGVLALYDRLGAAEFDDSDLATLRTFAGQAAVALDNVRAHEEAQRLSMTDPLTGLFNYRYLRESLRREVERAARFGRMLAVLVLDLDHFKEVNDRYGHAAGDAVLTEFACRMRGMIREVDFAFRHGGEEFVVLLPETDAAGGAALAQRLATAVRGRPVLVTTSRGPLDIPVTVSIGVAVYPDHGGTGPAVLEAADRALYEAKGAGRDTYRVALSAGASVRVQPPRQSRGG